MERRSRLSRRAFAVGVSLRVVSWAQGDGVKVGNRRMNTMVTR
jgi:hypothetical protein